MAKTNAIRMVEQVGIPYREAFYSSDTSDWNGLHAAQAIGFPPEQVFKTLVARGERSGVVVFCIPVCCELDLKKAAQAAHDKRVELVHVKELLGLTGYIRGGCSPVVMKKHYPTYLDETAMLFEEIAVSAGARGHQMILSPTHLAQFTQAKFVDLTE